MNNTETKLSEDELKTLHEIQKRIYNLSFFMLDLNINLSEGKELPEYFIDAVEKIHKLFRDIDKEKNKNNMTKEEYLNYSYGNHAVYFMKECGEYPPFHTLDNMCIDYQDILVKSKISEYLKIFHSEDKDFVSNIIEMESRVKERLERKTLESELEERLEIKALNQN